MNLSQQRPSVRFRNIEEKTQVLVDFLTEKNLSPILTVRCRPRPNCDAKHCFTNVESQVA